MRLFHLTGAVWSSTVVLIVCGMLTVAPTGASAATCQNWATQPVTPSGGAALEAVTVVSKCSAWTVGLAIPGPNPSTLVERWNGTSWTIQTSVNPGGGADALYGVAATSAANAWAVGYQAGPTFGAPSTTLAEHLVGTSWVAVPSQDDSSTTDSFSSVSTTSPTNTWAVGTTYNGTAFQTKIERWDGSSFGDVTTPDQGGHSTRNQLFGVSTTSATNAWAVGFYEANGVDQNLILHWNGTSWKIQKSPDAGGSSVANSLWAVAAISSTDAWAVGTDQDGPNYRTLVLHWNGVSWRIMKNPTVASTDTFLRGVTATSATNAWAVGYDQSGSNDRPVIEHWNGKTWSIETPTDSGILEAVDASSSTNAWTVGNSASEQATAFHCC
jgi:hypothetical protein